MSVYFKYTLKLIQTKTFLFLLQYPPILNKQVIKRF